MTGASVNPSGEMPELLSPKPNVTLESPQEPTEHSCCCEIKPPKMRRDRRSEKTRVYE